MPHFFAPRLLSLTLALTTVVLCRPVLGQRGLDSESSKGGQSIREAFKSVAAAANASTFRVRCNGSDACMGTAVGAEGYVLTKASELQGDVTVVLRNGRGKPAKIVGVAEDHDLALLKIDAKLKPIEWTDATEEKVGQWVVTTGVSDVPAALGVISVGRRRVPARSGMLGVLLADGTGGARVMQVVPDSPAESAGLQVDDVINRVNDTSVDGREALVTAIRRYMPGQTVTLNVVRGEKTVEARAKLVGGVGPAARAEMMNTMGGELSLRNANFPTVVQHDTVLTPKACGGPLLNLDGKAIGINIARAGRVESYAIPADVIESLLPDLESGRLAPKSQQQPTTKPAESKNEE